MGQPLRDHVLVRTTKSGAAAAASIGVRTAGRKRGELLGALHSCFARGEVFTQAGKYVNALMSDLKDRNGSVIAKLVGDKTQRLLITVRPLTGDGHHPRRPETVWLFLLLAH